MAAVSYDRRPDASGLAQAPGSKELHAASVFEEAFGDGLPGLMISLHAEPYWRPVARHSPLPQSRSEVYAHVNVHNPNHAHGSGGLPERSAILRTRTFARRAGR